MAKIDFEQALYDRFGQVKDFALGVRIAKYFYELRHKEEPVNEDLEEEIKRMIYDSYYDVAGIAIKGTSLYLKVDGLATIARHFAQWQKQKTIDKACEWLTANLANYFGHESAYTYVDDFRKALEED